MVKLHVFVSLSAVGLCGLAGHGAAWIVIVLQKVNLVSVCVAGPQCGDQTWGFPLLKPKRLSLDHGDYLL